MKEESKEILDDYEDEVSSTYMEYRSRLIKENKKNREIINSITKEIMRDRDSIEKLVESKKRILNPIREISGFTSRNRKGFFSCLPKYFFNKIQQKSEKESEILSEIQKKLNASSKQHSSLDKIIGLLLTLSRQIENVPKTLEEQGYASVQFKNEFLCEMEQMIKRYGSILKQIDSDINYKLNSFVKKIRYVKTSISDIEFSIDDSFNPWYWTENEEKLLPEKRDVIETLFFIKRAVEM